jgi:SAM-dependent methyltransferase
MFYFDKRNPAVLYCDDREWAGELCDGRRFEVKPDVLADFTALPFEDESFYHVVFDPPHLLRNARAAPGGYQMIKYGALGSDWKDMLAKGFSECFRVLKPFGTLIFKWNETDVKVGEVVKLSPIPPVYGHRSGKASKTHWLAFVKGL